MEDEDVYGWKMEDVDERWNMEDVDERYRWKM